MSGVETTLLIAGIWVLIVVAFFIGRSTATSRSSWIEPTTHDIGILPGGQIIHYSTCWCKKQSGVSE